MSPCKELLPFTSFPFIQSLWVSVVAVVGLVVHDEDVVDEVEAVRLGLEGRRHHLAHLLRVQLGELVYVLAATEEEFDLT